jgi:hypothetical protein
MVLKDSFLMNLLWRRPPERQLMIVNEWMPWPCGTRAGGADKGPRMPVLAPAASPAGFGAGAVD